MTDLNIVVGVTVLLVTAATVLWSNRTADRHRAAMKSAERSHTVDEQKPLNEAAYALPKGVEGALAPNQAVADESTAANESTTASVAISDEPYVVTIKTSPTFSRSNFVRMSLNKSTRVKPALPLAGGSFIAPPYDDVELSDYLERHLNFIETINKNPNLNYVNVVRVLREKGGDGPNKPQGNEPHIELADVDHANMARN